MVQKNTLPTVIDIASSLTSVQFPIIESECSQAWSGLVKVASKREHAKFCLSILCPFVAPTLLKIDHDGHYGQKLFAFLITPKVRRIYFGLYYMLLLGIFSYMLLSQFCTNPSQLVKNPGELVVYALHVILVGVEAATMWHQKIKTGAVGWWKSISNKISVFGWILLLFGILVKFLIFAGETGDACEGEFKIVRELVVVNQKNCFLFILPNLATLAKLQILGNIENLRQTI